MRKVMFDVFGMSCASCVSHVEKACRGVSGTSNINVNLLKNEMSVEVDSDNVIDNIIKSVSDAGYGCSVRGEKREAVIEKKDYRLHKLIASAIILLLLMYVSMFHMMFKAPIPYVFDSMKNPIGYGLIQFIIVLPMLYINKDYFISGYKKLFKRMPNMDTLISLGATFSVLYSIYCLFMISLGHIEYHKYLYFEAAGMILVFVSFGKFLENLSKKKTTKALDHLISLKPQEALILQDGKEVVIPYSDIKKNDIVILKQGSISPVDGIVVEGEASLDQSNITGESMPVSKKKNDEIVSATTILSGYLHVQAKNVGSDTQIEKIINLVKESSSSKAKISRLADKISSIFVPTILTIALLVFIFNLVYILIANPSFVSDAFHTSLNYAITTIVIACPCALGLATPVAIMVSTGKSASLGILVKNAIILEKTHEVNTVVLDKTGTITYGRPKVNHFDIIDNNYPIYDYIYSLERKSSHPLAKALVKYCKKYAKGCNISNFENKEGLGIIANIDENVVKLGNRRIVDNYNNPLIDKYENLGESVLVLAINDKVVAIISITDEIKETSKDAIKLLKDRKIEVIMITGDNEGCANAIANELGIDKYYANVYPSDKANIIKKIKEDKCKVVAMVGDGVNDAPALATADIAIAISSGSDIAIESSDIVLLKNDLTDVVNAIDLSKKTINTIKLGLFFAFFYNAICVFLSTGILFYITNGYFKMEPMYGSIAMSLSSVSVVLNALTINLFKAKESKNLIKESEEEEIMTLTISVSGMMCKHCKKHVEDAVLAVSGVSSAQASLEENNVVVECDDTVTKEALVEVIKNAGYEA